MINNYFEITVLLFQMTFMYLIDKYNYTNILYVFYIYLPKREKGQEQLTENFLWDNLEGMVAWERGSFGDTGITFINLNMIYRNI